MVKEAGAITAEVVVSIVSARFSLLMETRGGLTSTRRRMSLLVPDRVTVETIFGTEACFDPYLFFTQTYCSIPLARQRSACFSAQLTGMLCVAMIAPKAQLSRDCQGSCWAGGADYTSLMSAIRISF